MLVLLASLLQQALAPRDIEEMLEVGHTMTSWGAGIPSYYTSIEFIITMLAPDARISFVFI